MQIFFILTKHVLLLQVGLHANMSEDTRLLYCTTGVLLQKLIKEKSLRNYTHIILDEVHERDQDMDFLLIVIRRLMMTNSRNVKVILMSATINTGEVKNITFLLKKFQCFILLIFALISYSLQTILDLEELPHQ